MTGTAFAILAMFFVFHSLIFQAWSVDQNPYIEYILQVCLRYPVIQCWLLDLRMNICYVKISLGGELSCIFRDIGNTTFFKGPFVSILAFYCYGFLCRQYQQYQIQYNVFLWSVWLSFCDFPRGRSCILGNTGYTWDWERLITITLNSSLSLT